MYTICCKNMIFVLLLFTGLTQSIRALVLVDLRVPPRILQGSLAQLSCHWALGPTDEIYSVKWYKDGREFFRYVPKNHEPQGKFKLPGVDVKEFDLTGSNITLSPATLDTSGRYRCEVSGEKPLFPTVSRYADLDVIIIPELGPVLLGLQPRYKEGDKAEFTCRSGRSHPASQLIWYINGEPTPQVLPQTIHKVERELEISSLQLNFIITRTHFIGGRMKIKCLATVEPFYWRSSEKTALKQDPRKLNYKTDDFNITMHILEPKLKRINLIKISNSGISRDPKTQAICKETLCILVCYFFIYSLSIV